MDPSPVGAEQRRDRRGEGTSLVMGLPFLVMTTSSPDFATSSMSFRHLALNSDALTVFMMPQAG